MNFQLGRGCESKQRIGTSLFARQPKRTQGILVLGSLDLVLTACPEDHSTVLVVNNPQIGNWSTCQIAGQIFQHTIRSAAAMWRAFDEHVPVRFSDRIQPGFQFPPIMELGPVVFELQFVRGHQTTQTTGELSAKDSSQFDVIGEPRLAAVALGRMPRHHPLVAIQSGTGTGDDGMNVWVEAQFLVSRMQHHHGCGLELLLLTQGFFQRPPGTAEQQIVECLAIAQDQRRQLVRQREHDLKIVHTRQQQRARLIQPGRPPRSGTLWTMSIGARIVDVTS